MAGQHADEARGKVDAAEALARGCDGTDGAFVDDRLGSRASTRSAS